MSGWVASQVVQQCDSTAEVRLRGAMPVKCRYVIKAPQLNAAARSSTGGSTMQAGGELSTSGVFPA